MIDVGIIEMDIWAIFLALSLGLFAGVLANYVHGLIVDRSERLAGSALLNRGLGIVAGIVIGWAIWIIISGPNGSVIICLVVIIWAVLAENRLSRG